MEALSIAGQLIDLLPLPRASSPPFSASRHTLLSVFCASVLHPCLRALGQALLSFRGCDFAQLHRAGSQQSTCPHQVPPPSQTSIHLPSDPALQGIDLSHTSASPDPPAGVGKENTCDSGYVECIVVYDSLQSHGLQPARLCMEFSRQEYWSGLPVPTEGIFLTQGVNWCFLGFLYCRQILYC